MQRNRPLAQQYDRYTKQDFTVWHMLYEKQMILLKKYASHYYIDALDKVKFSPNAIPDFKEVNRLLSHLTGWQLTVVPGLVPAEKFFRLLSQKIFPATCWLRTMAEIEYIEEPDMFHDVFGHVPLLANQQYAMFIQAFGTLALQWLDQPVIIDILSRLYWFTIEFGLISENDATKIYGAGILSSPGETIHCMNAGILEEDFNIEIVLNTAYKNDIMQNRYFTIQSFEQLYNILSVAEKLIQQMKVPTL